MDGNHPLERGLHGSSSMPSIPSSMNYSPPRYNTFEERPHSLWPLGGRMDERNHASPSMGSPHSHTGRNTHQGLMDSLGGRAANGSPQTTPTSAMADKKLQLSSHDVPIRVDAGLRHRGNHNLPLQDMSEMPSFPEHGHGLRRTRSSRRQAQRQGQLTPERQQSLTNSQLAQVTASLESPMGDGYDDPESYGHDRDTERDMGGVSQDRELDYDSDSMEERQPQKRMRRRVVVATKDPSGKPYSAAEIRRMKRRITNRESARRMRLKRQEEWGEIKAQQRALRDRCRKQIERVTFLERQLSRASVEATHWRSKYRELEARMSCAQIERPASAEQPPRFNHKVEEDIYDFQDYSKVQLALRAGPGTYAGGSGSFDRSSSVVLPGVFGAPGGSHAPRPLPQDHSLHETNSLPLPASMANPPYLSLLTLPYGRAEEGLRGPEREHVPREKPLGDVTPLLKGGLDASLLASAPGAEGATSGSEELVCLKQMDIELGLNGDVEDVYGRSLSDDEPPFGDQLLHDAPHSSPLHSDYPHGH